MDTVFDILIRAGFAILAINGFDVIYDLPRREGIGDNAFLLVVLLISICVGVVASPRIEPREEE